MPGKAVWVEARHEVTVGGQGGQQRGLSLGPSALDKDFFLYHS